MSLALAEISGAYCQAHHGWNLTCRGEHHTLSPLRYAFDGDTDMSASRSGAITTHVGDGFVPVVDFSPFHSGTAKDKQDLAKQIDEACRTVGFYVMTGHGVSAELLARVEREARDFFDLPLDEKMKLHVGTAATTVGYAAIGDRALAYIRGRKSPPDLNEAFSIAKADIDPNDPYYQTALAKSLIPENRWPDNRPEFKRALTEYYKVVAELARELMGLWHRHYSSARRHRGRLAGDRQGRRVA